MKKVSLIICVLGFVSFLAKGQSEIDVILNYMPAVSLGQTADFTNNFSWRGVEFEVNNYIAEEVTIGISGGWNVFREKVKEESFQYNDALVTGTQFHYSNIIPLNVTFKRYFTGNELAPFLGFGIGTSYARQTNKVGIFSFTNDKWQFNISPEAGIHLTMGPEVVFSLKAKYSHSFEAGDFPSMSFLGLGIGIGML